MPSDIGVTLLAAGDDGIQCKVCRQKRAGVLARWTDRLVGMSLEASIAAGAVREAAAERTRECFTCWECFQGLVSARAAEDPFNGTRLEIARIGSTEIVCQQELEDGQVAKSFVSRTLRIRHKD